MSNLSAFHLVNLIFSEAYLVVEFAISQFIKKSETGGLLLGEMNDKFDVFDEFIVFASMRLFEFLSFGN